MHSFSPTPLTELFTTYTLETVALEQAAEASGSAVATADATLSTKSGGGGGTRGNHRVTEKEEDAVRAERGCSHPFSSLVLRTRTPPPPPFSGQRHLALALPP